MKFRMTLTPVDPTQPEEVLEATASLRERLGLAIYIAKDLNDESISISKELLTSNIYDLAKMIKPFFSKRIARIIAFEKMQEVYLEKNPGHEFEWPEGFV